MTLRDIFDIVADAYEEGRVAEAEAILAELPAHVAGWYWVIGPERGRVHRREPPLLDEWLSFRRLRIPIIRRVFASEIAGVLVSVQPMTMPSSLLFHMDYRYESISRDEPDTDASGSEG